MAESLERKVGAIVDALDVNGDGELSAEEVKVLFAQILGLPPEDIPDEHEDLATFVNLSGLPREEKVVALVEKMSPETIDQ